PDRAGVRAAERAAPVADAGVSAAGRTGGGVDPPAVAGPARVVPDRVCGAAGTGSGEREPGGAVCRAAEAGHAAADDRGTAARLPGDQPRADLRGHSD